MKKIIEKLSIGILTGAMLFSFPSTAAEKDAVVMNGVTQEMTQSSFWSKEGDSQKLLMDASQIQALNQSNFLNPETNMNVLSKLPEQFDGVALRNALAGFEDPKGLYRNDEPVTASYYGKIRENIKGASAQKVQAVQYGFAVRRTLMKSLPCSDPLSDGIGDLDWDNLALAPVLANEPLVIQLKTADGAFCYVIGEVCSGWVPAKDVATCHSKAEWIEAQQYTDFIVVTGDAVTLEASLANETHSELQFEMGTILPLRETPGMVDNRMSWYNYVVTIPGRDEKGFYQAEQALIPMSRDVSRGFLALNRENIVRQAYKCLGNRYGWGGSINSQDCSSFVREVYLCFGLKLPRNTTWQSKMQVKVIDLTDAGMDEKEACFANLPTGAIVQFPGHEMLYLGESRGDYYTINDVSSLLVDNEAGRVKYRARGVIINGLKDAKRASGISWFEAVNKVIIPWE